jgi:hypothetical protein
MSAAHRRESMIALRAAHQAVRVGRDLSHLPIDLEHVHCEGCNAELDWQRDTGVHYQIVCPACGRTTDLPCHLRPRVMIPVDAPADDVTDDDYNWQFPPDSTPMDEDLSAPRWLTFFFVSIVLISALFGAFIIVRQIAAELR